MNSKVVVASLIAISCVALLLPLFADVKREERVFARIENVDVKVSDVNDSHVTLNFEITLRRPKVLVNSTILAKVYDSKTNVLLTEVSKSVPERSRSEFCEEVVPISFEKSRNYRVVLSVMKDYKLLDARELKLANLDTLVPEDKALKVVLKDADFEVRSVKNGEATIFVRFYVESLRNYNAVAHIKAVQYESNLLADDVWKEVTLESGKTTLIEGNLSVPKDYNYLVKLELWKKGSLLKTWSKPLNLAPTKRIPENVTEREVKFEIEEFVRTPVPVEKIEYAEKGKAMPGFEAILLLLSGGVVLWRRRSS